jgi:hypothetical protein
MLTSIVPVLDSVSEEYFVTNCDYTYSSSQTVYAIPPRAVGGKLRDVVFVDNSGNEIAIPRLRPEQIKGGSQSIRYSPAPWGFYLANNSIVLYVGASGTTPAAYPTLRLKYLRRPNILTLQANAGQILAINGNVATLDNVPTTWTTSTVVDVISNTPHFSSIADDKTITLISGFDVTFSAIPAAAAVGDWVAVSGYSPIPQIPVETHLLLAQYGAAKTLEAMGDGEGVQIALAKAEAMKKDFLMIVSPRVEGSVIKLYSNNGIDSWIGGNC